MREPYFDTEEKISDLLADLKSWEGTKFRANACTKGVAVCCHKLAGAILMNSGHLKEFKIPDGNPRDAITMRESVIEKYIDENLSYAFDPIEIPDPFDPFVFRAGDVLGHRFGRVLGHLSIVSVREHFFHVLAGITRESRIDDPTYLYDKRGKNLLLRAWRPIKWAKPSYILSDTPTIGVE